MNESYKDLEEGKKIKNMDDLKLNKYYILEIEYPEDIYNTDAYEIIIKLENSLKIKSIDSNKVFWVNVDNVEVLDELPKKYIRKEKLEEINKKIEE